MLYHIMTFSFTAMSMLLSGYMTTRLIKEIAIRNEYANIVRKPILGLFFCDLLFAAMSMANIVSLIFPTIPPWDDTNPAACIFIIAMSEFSIVGICFWSLIIDWMLCMVLLGYPTSRFSRVSFCQNYFVWIAAIILSSSGIGLNFYGVSNLNLNRCGVTNKWGRYVFHTFPILLSACTSIVVLSLALRKRKMFQDQNKHILLDITFFCFSFVAVWIIPIVGSMFATPDNQNFWNPIYEIMPSLPGITDFIVWALVIRNPESTLGSTVTTIPRYASIHDTASNPTFNSAFIHESTQPTSGIPIETKSRSIPTESKHSIQNSHKYSNTSISSRSLV